MPLAAEVATSALTEDAERASGAFAEDALLAYWNGDGEETAARTLAHGRQEIRAALGRGAVGPGRPEILISLEDDASCLVEGRLTGQASDALATFVASLQLDSAGSITRCLLYRTPLVEPSPTWETQSDGNPGDAMAVLDTYFEHLEHGRFQAAADCFSEDCLYSHPPYAPGAGRAEFRGREELLAGFVRRGNRPYQHSLAVTLQRGSECLLEGTASGTELGGSFVSSLSLDGDGLIRRYAAFYCEPPVPRR
jgi:hypothetical protein